MTATTSHPAPEVRGRAEFHRGQKAMQRRTAALVMEMASGLSDSERRLLARVAEAMLKLEIKA